MFPPHGVPFPAFPVHLPPPPPSQELGDTEVAVRKLCHCRGLQACSSCNNEGYVVRWCKVSINLAGDMVVSSRDVNRKFGG